MLTTQLHQIFSGEIIRRLPGKWKWSFLVWAVAKFTLSLWGMVIWLLGLTHSEAASYFYHEVQPMLSGFWAPLVGVWQRWDAIHYIRIAENGYNTVNLTAFFPLYPFLGGLLSRLTGLETTSALLWVSNLAFLFALVLLYQIVDEIYSPQAARGAVVAAVLFPTSFFFLAPYPHSLALLLVLFSYQSARRNRWLLALLAALAAGLCHSTALPLAILLCWEAVRWIKTSTARMRWALLLVSIGAFLGVGLFIAWRIFKGFPSYTMLMVDEWGRSSQWPWISLLRIPDLLRSGYLFTSGWLNLALLILTVTLLVWSIRQQITSHIIYLAVLLVYLLSMNVSGEPFSSFSRYLLLAFPLFIGLAQWGGNPKTKLLLVTLGFIIEFFTSALFFMWVWVA